VPDQSAHVLAGLFSLQSEKRKMKRALSAIRSSLAVLCAWCCVASWSAMFLILGARTTADERHSGRIAGRSLSETEMRMTLGADRSYSCNLLSFCSFTACTQLVQCSGCDNTILGGLCDFDLFAGAASVTCSNPSVPDTPQCSVDYPNPTANVKCAEDWDCTCELDANNNFVCSINNHVSNVCCDEQIGWTVYEQTTCPYTDCNP
jgi:hypothetical protein